jgi:hypothetical protein
MLKGCDLVIEEIIMLIMKIAPKGRYEKIGEEYNFEIENGNCIITVTESAVEFKIPTIKWIPGSYEPIEGSELYKRIGWEDIEALSEKEKLNKITKIIDELQRK